MSDTLEKLGTILDDDTRRDAVHIAVAPVIAGERLLPGQRIGIVEGVAYRDVRVDVGIVDPFLRKPIGEGQRFYIWLYPQTITSLRHVWSHPDFPEEVQ